MSTKKKLAPKKTAASLKTNTTKSKVVKKAQPKAAPKAPLKPIAKAPGKKAPKKAVTPTVDDRLAKEALKLVDEVSGLLRTGIKTSHQTTSKVRAATHKKAHTLLGKATGYLDDMLKTGTSLVSKAINKI